MTMYWRNMDNIEDEWFYEERFVQTIFMAWLNACDKLPFNI